MTPLLSTLRFIATHPLSSKQRLRAFCRYGRWQITSRLQADAEFEWIGGAKLVVRSGMTGATGNIYCGLHEFVEMAFLLHLLRSADLFVDVGANIGSYTILAAAVCRASVIAVEPDPCAMWALRRNLDANNVLDRVAALQLALGAAEGQVRFTIGRDTTNRVAVGSDADTRVVQLRALDAVLEAENPTFIKMDVEGYEPQVMEGARVTIRKPSLLAVQLESVSEATRAMFEESGFTQAFYEPFRRTLVVGEPPVWATNSQNSLFIRDVAECRSRIEGAETRRVLGCYL